MSNATELLERVLETWKFWHPALDPESEPLFRDIREYLADESEAEPMTEEEINNAYQTHFREKSYVADFLDGIRFAEKHHGIGGDDE